MPSPTDIKGVRRALGMFSYYRKFVPRFSIIAEPLIRLSKKRALFEWTSEQEKAFRMLIEELNKSATLTNINSTDPVMLKTDASKAGVAGMLLQLQGGLWKLVSCCSRRLAPAEANYAITDLEALAIIYSVCRFRHFLLGRFFKIVTDHHALCVLTSRQPQSARLQRWALLLSEFHYEVVYAKGNAHADIDCLSRAPVDTADPYMDQIMTIQFPVNKDDWIAAYDDDESKRFLEKAQMNHDQFELTNNLIYWRGKLFVPEKKRESILSESHDSSVAGHDGVEATLNRMQEIWWPKMSQAVKDYVASCDICQKRKAERMKPAGSCHMHEATAPLAKICFDYIGPLPETINGKRFIVVAIDVFSRFIQAKALKDQTATRFIRYIVSYFAAFGIPRCIVTDNAKTFDNRELKELETRHNISHIYAASRHHQGNAPVERAIQSLNEKLAMLLKEDAGHDWEQVLSSAIMSMNTKKCRSTSYTPYELMFGREHDPIQRSLTTELAFDANETLELSEEMRARANLNQTNSHLASKLYYDRKHRERNFEIGDKVVVERSDRRQKLSDKYEGPFEVVSREKDIYQVKNLSKNETRIKHVSQLKPYRARIMNAVTLFTVVLIASNVVLAGNRAPDGGDDAAYWMKVDDRFVSPGTETNGLDIVWVSPCPILLRFHRMMKINPQLRLEHPWYPRRMNNTIQSSVPMQPAQAPLQPAQAPMQPKQPMQPMQPMQLMQQSQPVQPVVQQPIRNQYEGPQTLREDQRQQPLYETNGFKVREPLPNRDPIVRKQKTNELQDDPRRKRSGDNVQIAYEYCERSWAEFMAALARFNYLIKVKRQAGILAAAGVLYLSNLFTTAEEKLFGKNHEGISEEEQWEIVKKKLANLNEQEDLQQLFNQITKTELHEMSKMLNQLHSAVHYLISTEPEISAMLSLLLDRISSKKAIVDRVYTSLTLNSTDMISIGQLVTPKLYNHLHPADTSLKQLRFLGDGRLRITLSGQVRSSDTDVYQVSTLDYITRDKEQYYKNIYVGKKWLIRNSTSDCVRAIEPTFSKFIKAECTEKHFRDARLKVWNKVPVKKNDNNPSNYLEAWPHFIIQCWPHNITILEPIQKTYSCPMRPFPVNATWTFATSDNMVNHHGYTAQQIEEKVIDIGVIASEAHQTDAAFEFDSEQQRAYDAVLEEKKDLSKQFVALEIGDKSINYRHTTIGLGSLVAVIGILLVIRYTIVLFKTFGAFVVPRQQRSNGMEMYSAKINRIQRRRSRERESRI